MTKPSLYGLPQEQLESWLGERGHRKYHAMQVWESLYRKRTRTFQQMLEAGIKPECVQLLQERFEIGTLEEHTRQRIRGRNGQVPVPSLGTEI